MLEGIDYQVKMAELEKEILFLREYGNIKSMDTPATGIIERIQTKEEPKRHEEISDPERGL